MAKANLTLPDGTTVGIEGSAEEVAALLEKLSGTTKNVPAASIAKKRKRRGSGSTSEANTAKKADGPTSLVTELAEGGYFKTKRTIGDIQKKLEELGHIYAQSSISPILTRLTRKRTVRRIKEKKTWVYIK
jgi:hypothetical protein